MLSIPLFYWIKYQVVSWFAAWSWLSNRRIGLSSAHNLLWPVSYRTHFPITLFYVWCFLSVEAESQTSCCFQTLRYVYLGVNSGFPCSLHSDLFWLIGTFTLLLYLFTPDTKLMQVWGVLWLLCGMVLLWGFGFHEGLVCVWLGFF